MELHLTLEQTGCIICSTGWEVAGTSTGQRDACPVILWQVPGTRSIGHLASARDEAHVVPATLGHHDVMRETCCCGPDDFKITWAMAVNMLRQGCLGCGSVCTPGLLPTSRAGKSSHCHSPEADAPNSSQGREAEAGKAPPLRSACMLHRDRGCQPQLVLRGAKCGIPNKMGPPRYASAIGLLGSAPATRLLSPCPILPLPGRPPCWPNSARVRTAFRCPSFVQQGQFSTNAKALQATWNVLLITEMGNKETIFLGLARNSTRFIQSVHWAASASCLPSVELLQQSCLFWQPLWRLHRFQASPRVLLSCPPLLLQCVACPVCSSNLESFVSCAQCACGAP